MRIAQFISEAVMSVYTDESDVDMMQEPEKYAEFTDRFSKIMKSNGITRSEDKDFFCGWMHTEGMSLGALILAKQLGSSSLTTSSAILRLDKCRYTVAPVGCDPDLYKNLQGNLPIYLKVGKKNNKSYASINYIHFMQGVRAMAGAMINTVFSAGLDCIQKECAPDILITEIMTTSDDSTRGVCIGPNPVYNSTSTMMDYINMGPKLVQHCMMKDSTDKPILSDRIAEFNNVAIGPNGMLPHQFVHTHLIIQPLLGETLIDDIISCVAQSRSSLAWGDSIDCARSAMDAYRVLLEQKWLLTTEEIDLLYDMRLIPSTDEELLQGYHLHSDVTKVKLLRLVDDDTKQMIISGDKSAMDVLRKHRIYKPGKRPKVQLLTPNSECFTVKSTMEQINSTRKMRGRINAKYIRRTEYKIRQAAKNNLMKVLREPINEITPSERELIKDMPKPPEVTIMYTIPRGKDLMPTKQGLTSYTVVRPNIKSILAKRLANLQVTYKLDDIDSKLADLDDRDFHLFLKKQRTISQYEGFKFKSPGGLPLMRFHNDTIFARPMCFKFVLDLPNGVSKPRLFTHNNVAYPNFTPCFFGGFTLNMCKTSKFIPALGFSWEGEQLTIFYKHNKSRLKSYTTDTANGNVVKFSQNKINVLCPLKKDLTAINPSIFGIDCHIPNLNEITGDSVALLNYGNYINTSAQGASKIMASIFEKLGGSYMKQISGYKPQYPYFPDSAVSFTRASVNHVTGTKCITRLKIRYDNNGLAYQDFDVNGDNPIRVETDIYTIESMWE